MRRIISILMENEPGALSRVVGLFSQRGYNIETLTVAPTEDETLSRLTMTTTGDDKKIEQITKHLNKLIEVVKLVDLTEGAHIEREIMLMKVKDEDFEKVLRDIHGWEQAMENHLDNSFDARDEGHFDVLHISK